MSQIITKHKIQVLNQEQEFLCPSGITLLVGMEAINSHCIDVGCRGGGCGVCKIKVINGSFLSKRMSKAHITDEDLKKGVVLACRIFPTSDLKIEVLHSPTSKQVIV
ncbi:MAG: ferredoxin [Neptuniibacter pectenicola]|jgi:ferredoxin